MSAMDRVKKSSVVACAVAMAATFGVRSAIAQTVVVRNAQPGSTIELQLNTEAPKSTPAGPTGDATIAVPLSTGTDQIDVRFFVDMCGAVLRVQMMSPGVQPGAPAAGCNRTEVSGVFVMRRVTTFVVDIEGALVSVHLTQGPAPPDWLGQSSETARKYFLTTPPRGFLLFVGGSLATIGNMANASCGSVSACTSDGFNLGAATGAALWVTRYFGAQATLAKPTNATANGSGDTFRFGSTFETRVFTLAGMAGVPAGPVRIYGLGGATWHRAKFITTETINDQTVVVDNVSQTIPGGTAIFEHRTEGWSWLVGGGIEAWMTKWVAIYAEFQHAKLKGAETGTSEGGIDDRLRFISAGARVRLGR
jgi:opacity protein-like surface antigen